MYSMIEWKKGTPPSSNFYLVISESGRVDVARWYCDCWDCDFEVYGWTEIWDVKIYHEDKEE